MQLYHQTLIKPTAIAHAHALHLFPTRNLQHTANKQLLLLKSTSIELYHYIANKQTHIKYQFKLFAQEEFFANITALEPVNHVEEDMQKDLILVTLNNGKYQLLQWLPKMFKFVVLDQNMLFSSQFSIQNRLTKPIFGHYIAVNNEAKLVMIACANWQYKVYEKSTTNSGVKLKVVYHFTNQLNSSSICLQLVSAINSCSFYSLRIQADQHGKKHSKVYALSQMKDKFEQRQIVIDDNSIHMLIARSGENNLLAFGKEYLHYSINKEMVRIELAQNGPVYQTHSIRRLNKQKREEFFIINEQSEVYLIRLDEKSRCSLTFVQKIMPINHITILQKNIFFVISRHEDNYLIHFSNKFKIEEKVDKVKTNIKVLKEDKDQHLIMKNSAYREIEILISLPSAKVIKDMKVGNFENTINKQILVTGSKNGGKKGFYSIIKYGLKVKQYLSINFQTPIGIWCLKKNIIHKNHSFIVLTFNNRKTASYYYQNKKLTQTNELKLQQNQESIHINKLYDNSNVQVTPSKIRHIRQGNIKEIFIKGRIMKAIAVNQGRQLFILLIGGYMEYYELNDKNELKFIKEFTLDSEAHFIDYGVPEIVDGKPYCKLFVIGKNNYLVSLLTYQNKTLELSTSRNIKSQIYSITLLPKENHYILYVGTNFGKIVKLFISKEGQISEQVQESVIGDKNVKISKVSIMNKYSILRLSPEPMISYIWQQQQQECFLPFTAIDFFIDINIQGMQSSNIFLTYYDNYIRFIEVCGFNNLLQLQDKQLQMSGKKIVMINDYIGILSEKKLQKQEGDVWTSALYIINPKKQYTISLVVNFKEIGYKCISMAYVSKGQNKGYLCFGCVMGYQSYPKLFFQMPVVKVYSFEAIGDEITVDELYSYSIDDIPTAMQVYSDKLLIGVGRSINLYDIYPSKLIKRITREGVSSLINKIISEGEKIITTQLSNSFVIYRLNLAEKCFDYIGSDQIPRFISTSCLLDESHGVLAGSDKFGNFFVSKFSEEIKEEFQSGSSSNKYCEYTDCNKLQLLGHFNIGQIVTSINIGRLDEKKPLSILYTTIDGRLGMFYPFENEQIGHLKLLISLQAALRKQSLVSATNQEYFRSSLQEVKSVIDGDFCKYFDELSEQQKNKVSHSLNVEVKDILNVINYFQSKFK